MRGLEYDFHRLFQVDFAYFVRHFFSILLFNRLYFGPFYASVYNVASSNQLNVFNVMKLINAVINEIKISLEIIQWNFCCKKKLFNLTTVVNSFLWKLIHSGWWWHAIQHFINRQHNSTHIFCSTKLQFYFNKKQFKSISG